MSYSVESLKPAVVWKYFEEIRKIPRGSGNEKELAEAIMRWASETGCESKTDKVGNVLVTVAASPGLEDAPAIVLQGHIDMVCEKNSDKDFDFEKDAIQFVRDGEWLTADGTTLGADNGIGVATGLAFMEVKDVPHGKLELLFTVDEETGLNGARGLTSDFLTGRMMFNLDSEEDGVFYVGCAGGRDTNINLPLETTTPTGDLQWFDVSVKGLRGGHSGMDIVINRGNAIRLLARSIKRASEQVGARLASITGGDKHNAIPRESDAVVAAPKDKIAQFKTIFETSVQEYLTEFGSAEPDLTVTVQETTAPANMMTETSQSNVIGLICGLPHGVLALMRDIPGAVETSSNLARVRTETGALTILTSSRSSVGTALDGVIDHIESVCALSGAEADVDDGYPGWQPNPDSPMLAEAKKVWRTVHGTDAKFEVIHAGLECGLIGEKFEGMDMISLGPTIMNPHSPEEKLHIESVDRFFAFVSAYVKSIANA